MYMTEEIVEVLKWKGSKYYWVKMQIERFCIHP